MVDFLVKVFPTRLARQLRLTGDIPLALERTFLQIEKEWYDIEASLPSHERTGSGSTATVVLITGSRHVYIASLGDTRAILSRGPSMQGTLVELTDDHNFRNPVELERLLQNNVEISEDCRIGMMIEVSRSLGDFDPVTLEKIPGVTPVPEIRHLQLDTFDEFIVIACDGLWDVMSSDTLRLKARRLIYDNDELTGVADDLVSIAYELKSMDNLTAIVLGFPKVYTYVSKDDLIYEECRIVPRKEIQKMKAISSDDAFE